MRKWLGIVVVAGSVLVAGCSRQKERPATSQPKTNENKSVSVPVHQPAANAAPPAPTHTSPPAAVPVEQLEVDYLKAKDVLSKVSVLNDISDGEPDAAVAVLGRLFYFEKDNALREEVLNQLVYVDGAEAAKLELLADAVKPNQPSSIRYAAIDIMVELGDLSAVSVLQPFVNDTDAGIRDAAVDAIESLQKSR